MAGTTPPAPDARCARCGTPDDGTLRKLTEAAAPMCWTCRIETSAAHRKSRYGNARQRDHISRQLRRAGRPQRRRQR